MSKKRLRIGVLDLTNSGWLGGLSYTHMIIQSLAAACRDGNADLCAFTIGSNRLPEGVAGVEAIPVPSDSAPRLLRLARRFAPLPNPSNLFWLAKRHGIDVVLPNLGVPRFTFGRRCIAWIPDFQHVHLPQFFTDRERRERDAQFHLIAEKSDAIILSSDDAHRDFLAFAPHAREKAVVLPFPSLFAFNTLPEGNASSALTKYRIPAKFALIVNQLWAHKNHAVVIEAIRILRTQGLRIPLVMTGLPNDPRDLQNTTVSNLLQQVAVHDLREQVYMLGRVPYGDLMSLMRSTALFIQPSRFEGWNTSVQDMKAIGRPMICSDLPVHREQVKNCLGFFGCDDAENLAALIASVWPGTTAGPNHDEEARALAAEREFARSHGAALLQLCRRVTNA